MTPETFLESLFASGAAVDLVLAVLAMEVLVLTVATPGPMRLRRLATLASASAPGVCLLLALRAALTGAGWAMVALWLALSFPFHLADILRRK